MKEFVEGSVFKCLFSRRICAKENELLYWLAIFSAIRTSNARLHIFLPDLYHTQMEMFYITSIFHATTILIGDQYVCSSCHAYHTNPKVVNELYQSHVSMTPFTEHRREIDETMLSNDCSTLPWL